MDKLIPMNRTSIGQNGGEGGQSAIREGGKLCDADNGGSTGQSTRVIILSLIYSYLSSGHRVQSHHPRDPFECGWRGWIPTGRKCKFRLTYHRESMGTFISWLKLWSVCLWILIFINFMCHCYCLRRKNTVIITITFFYIHSKYNNVNGRGKKNLLKNYRNGLLEKVLWGHLSGFTLSVFGLYTYHQARQRHT